MIDVADTTTLANSIWQLNDTILTAISNGLDPLGWTIDCEYDDQTYYRLTAQDGAEFDWQTDKAELDKLLPVWVTKLIETHWSNYENYYHDANLAF
jgi:hypothetical protein